MNIELFEWGPRYLTGIAVIDRQHKRLVEIINSLGEVVIEADAQRFATVVAEVSDYAVYHFQCEEAIWDKGVADATLCAEHRLRHSEFFKQVKQFQLDLSRQYKVAENAKLLHQFLSSWLILHILGDDQAMARTLQGSEAGASDSLPSSLPSLSETVLLSAIQNLYDTLTTMNLRLRENNASLEQRVAERTQSLMDMNEELRNEQHELLLANTQLDQVSRRLLESERMAAVGQLAAGVAHEINTPIGFVKSNLVTLGEYVEDMSALLDCYAAAEPLLARDPEAMAAIRLAKNHYDIEYVRKDLKDLLRESGDGMDRVRDIVCNLKTFSHVDQMEWVRADLHVGLNSTIAIAGSDIRQKAELQRRFGTLPPILCNPGQLNQVFLNLLMNAVQSIHSKGTITVRTGVLGDEVWCEVEDTGSGIAPDLIKRIFDPFFTTKDVGKGTGLGLSMAWSIVQKHGGRIDVDSQVGKGTCFRVYLPVNGPPVVNQEA